MNSDDPHATLYGDLNQRHGIHQTVDRAALGFETAAIDAGAFAFTLSAAQTQPFEVGWQGRIALDFIAGDGSTVLTTAASSWKIASDFASPGTFETITVGPATAPAGTRSVRLWAEVQWDQVDTGFFSTYQQFNDFALGYDGGSTGFSPVLYECTAAGTTAGAAPSFDPTRGSTTGDGAVVWTARSSFNRYAAVGTVTDRRVFTISATFIADADYFQGGRVAWVTGANAGTAQEIIGWEPATHTLGLLDTPGAAVVAGDQLLLTPGCPKTFGACKSRFANGINFRGEPHVPGNDAFFRYPDQPDD